MKSKKKTVKSKNKKKTVKKVNRKPKVISKTKSFPFNNGTFTYEVKYHEGLEPPVVSVETGCSVETNSIPERPSFLESKRPEPLPVSSNGQTTTSTFLDKIINFFKGK